MSKPSTSDVLVIGGGPGGSIAALVAARAGLSVTLIEREPGSRFHVGESFLPRSTTQLRELGLLDGVLALDHITKNGAAFVSGAGVKEAAHLTFDLTLDENPEPAYNLEREGFDAYLLDEARRSGAVVASGTRVRRIDRLAPGDVAVTTDRGEFAARVLIDASGQNTLAARHLSLRKTIPGHERTAHFGHFRGVTREPMPQGGYPVIVMMDEGWFWVIPIDRERTSIGVVLAADFTRKNGIRPDHALRWAIERCPEMRRRCADAVFPERNGVAADYAYDCAPYVGPGCFLVGDAAAFMDPVFSGGVCIAMLSGQWAAEEAFAVLNEDRPWDQAAHSYSRQIGRTFQTLFNMIEHYYQPSYRDLLHHGQGPLAVHRATIEMLTGRSFPAPRFAVRWRMWLMSMMMRTQRHVRLVPRVPRWSLFQSPANPIPDATLPMVKAAERSSVPAESVAIGASE